MNEIALHKARRQSDRAKAASTDDEATIAAAVKRLAELSPLAYDRVRLDEAEALGVRATTLDSEVERARGPSGKDAAYQGAALTLTRPEPWPQAVDGEALIDELGAMFARYLVLPEGGASAMALWTLHTYVFEHFTVTPRLALLSAEGRCGKTTALRLLLRMAAKTMLAANITPAALFRTLALARPTLLIDEGDTFVHASDELRGVLNSGHGFDGGLVRTVGDDYTPRMFSTWAPVAIAAIGQLPDTLMDRSVIVRMQRRRVDERVERFRLDRVEPMRELARKCARWAEDCAALVAAADPACPEWMSDRAADNWRVLLAIAEVAGRSAFARAVTAARKLTPTSGATPSVGTALLEDVRRVFQEKGAERIASVDLVAALVQMEERPWPECRNGQALSTAQLARLLALYGVKPEQFWVGGRNMRGYCVTQFDDAFARYLPDASARPLDASNSAGSEANSAARSGEVLADGDAQEASKTAGSSGLADETRETPEGGHRRRVKPGMREK